MMLKRASKTYAQKARKRVLKTPPGDLPEASRRLKSTPKGASDETSASPNNLISGPGASGLAPEAPGPLRGRPGTRSGAFRGRFRLIFDACCSALQAPEIREATEHAHTKLPEQTRRNDRHYEDPGAGKHTIAHMKPIAENLTGKCA